MNRTISLAIPTPCAEKWDTFTPAPAGGYCGSCNKVVIDFTRMTDDQVLAFFGSRPAHTCGRFNFRQLKTYDQQGVPQITPGLTLLKAGLISFFLLLLSRESFSQTQPAPRTEIIDQQKKDANGKIIAEQFVTGLVVSAEDGSALPGVNVQLKNFAVGTTTDVEGRFSFPQKLREGDVLVFQFIGLESSEYTVRHIKEEKIEIKMTCSYDIMGEVQVVAGQVYVDKRSGLRRLWSKLF